MSSGLGLSCAGGGDQSWQHVNAQSQSQSQAVCLAFLPWFWLLLLRHNGLGGVGIGGSRGGSVAWWFGGSMVVPGTVNPGSSTSGVAWPTLPLTAHRLLAHKIKYSAESVSPPPIRSIQSICVNGTE